MNLKLYASLQTVATMLSADAVTSNTKDPPRTAQLFGGPRRRRLVANGTEYRHLTASRRHPCRTKKLLIVRSELTLRRHAMMVMLRKKPTAAVLNRNNASITSSGSRIGCSSWASARISSVILYSITIIMPYFHQNSYLQRQVQITYICLSFLCTPYYA